MPSRVNEDRKRVGNLRGKATRLCYAAVIPVRKLLMFSPLFYFEIYIVDI